MLRGFLLAICFAYLTVFHHTKADNVNIEKDVLILTDTTINDTLSTHKYVLLELYAPWCGHCQQLLPQWAAAASELATTGLPVALAKIDASAESKTSSWLDVKGYPTILWFADGLQSATYAGSRTKDAIVAWVKKKAGPPADELADLNDLKDAQSGSEVFLVGYFAQFEGPEYEAFLAAARAVEDWPVYQTSSQAVADALGLAERFAFAVGTNFLHANSGFQAVTSVGHPAFDGDAELSSQILEFLKIEQLPPYLPYTSSSNSRVFALEQQVFLLGPIERLQPGGEALNAVVEAHRKFKGKVAFATAALGQDPADMLIGFFGADPRLKDVQVIGFHPEDKKYMLLEPLSTASLIEFCQGVIDDTYPRFYKSAPLPAKPKESHVTVVVGSTFNEIVLSPDKDVLLMVYSSVWSDKSKHLSVVWKKLALHVRHVESLVVAKFDGSANEHAMVAGTSFPSVWLYPAGSTGKGVKFTGEPNTKELLRFLKRHASIPLDAKARKPAAEQRGPEEL